MIRSLLRALLLLAVALWAAGGTASAQGTIPLAMTQQVDVNGHPLASCLLYIYQAGTVSTQQNAYQDFGLTQVMPNPMQCDQTGRVPMFWLANGLIHARLTDASGQVVVDVTMQVLGPSSGGGGGGGTVDPTTIASTGDIKFRATGEVLTGWVRLNGLTIGSATSGASERANADTQNLFVYEWTNCAQPTSNVRCAVSGGLGATALADFNANKTLTLPDWRDRGPVGRDCMGNSCRGALTAGNIGSGGGDGVDTGGAFGGAPNTVIGQANLPNVTLPATSLTFTASWLVGSCDTLGSTGCASGDANVVVSGTQKNVYDFWNGGHLASPSFAIGGNVPLGGSGTAFANISAFELGTWFVKL